MSSDTQPTPNPPVPPPVTTPAQVAEATTRARTMKEVLVAAGCGFVASVIIVWMIFRPATAEPAVAQYFVCIAVGLYLSLFFFILWPQSDLVAGMPTPWYSAQPVRVAGPIVLFFVTFGLLYSLMPAREQFGAVYELDKSPYTIRYSTDTSFELRGRRGEKLTYYLIRGDGTQSNTLKAVYLQFPPGESEMEVVFKHFSYEDLPLKVRRSDVVLDLSGLKKKPNPE
jgi:hypothetical protein